MDPHAILAAFDAQIRRRPAASAPRERVEKDDKVIRVVSDAGGWHGVAWSDLDEASADAVIAAEIARFAEEGHPWEWKHYSYDRPADLQDRLRAAGFTPEPVETLLAAEIADLTLEATPPSGVELRAVVDEQDVAALMSVHREVFGEVPADLGESLLAALSSRPSTAAAVVAFAGPTPIATGRVEFHAGTDFASFWGDGTVSVWRGRGVYRAIVAYRAALAAARGFRYIQVDASADSRPILQRLGFIELGTTTPFIHPGTAD